MDSLYTLLVEIWTYEQDRLRYIPVHSKRFEPMNKIEMYVPVHSNRFEPMNKIEMCIPVHSNRDEQ